MTAQVAQMSFGKNDVLHEQVPLSRLQNLLASQFSPLQLKETAALQFEKWFNSKMHYTTYNVHICHTQLQCSPCNLLPHSIEPFFIYFPQQIYTVAFKE